MFLQNKYALWYNSIINKAKSQERSKRGDVYYEKHHIIPKSLGGDNSKENLVLLTPREHIISHQLLVRMCVNKNDFYKMIKAVESMLNDPRNKRKLTTKEYDRNKNLLKGYITPDFVKEKISKNKKGKYLGKNNKLYGSKGNFLGKSHTTETKQKISLSAKISKLEKMIQLYGVEEGKSRYDLYIERQKISQKNRVWKMSDEQKEKIRIINTGKKRPKDDHYKRKISEGVRRYYSNRE